MRDDRRFQRVTAVYVCSTCGKKTRDTGAGEGACGLCKACYELSGFENEHNDGHHDGRPNPACPFCQAVGRESVAATKTEQDATTVDAGFPRKEPGTWTKPQRKGRQQGFWVYIDSVTLQEANVDPDFPIDRIRIKRCATPIRKRNGELRGRYAQTGVHLRIKFLKEGEQ